MKSNSSRGLFAGLIAAGALALAGTPGSAEDATTLFKIVTVKDAIVIALSAEDIGVTGGNDVTHIGKAIKDKGELTVWQYAIRKGTDGALEEAPLSRVSLLGAESLRVEPYVSAVRVVPVPSN